MYEQYLSGATLEEVGDRHGLTKERVRQLFQDADVPTRSTRQSRAISRARKRDENTARICEAFSELKSIDEVAVQLGIAKDIVGEVVKAKFRKSERSRPAPRKYKDEELIALLKEASEHSVPPLTVKRYARYANGRETSSGLPWPTHQTFGKRFGSWRSAVNAAGLPASKPLPMGNYRRYEEQHCVNAVRTAARVLGKVPTTQEYAAFARNSKGVLPSAATVRHRCGTWTRALAKAGM